MTDKQARLKRVRCRAVALDFGSTISIDREDHVIGQKGVDPRVAAALHELAGLGVRLLLASNASVAETRWPALQMAAGVDELFAVGLVSYSLNVRKDEPLFYDLVITAAQCRLGKCCLSGTASLTMCRADAGRDRPAPNPSPSEESL